MTILSVAGHVSRRMLERYSHIRMEAKRTALDAIVRRAEGSVFDEDVHQNVHQLQVDVLDASAEPLN